MLQGFRLKRPVLALASLIMMLGCTVSPVLAADTTGAKNEGDTFIVGFDAEFPPYGYKDDNGEYIGFDLDLAAEVCERNGWTLKKQPIDWDSKDMELNTGMIDCIWNGFTMNGREDDYTWSSAYIDNSQVVVVRKDSGITTPADLAGKNVIVQSDSSALAAFTSDDATDDNKELAASFKSLQQVSDYNSAFLNLESGAADAVCMDIGVAKYEVSSRGDKFTILDDHISSEQYGIGFKLGNTGLRDQVQATLEQMNDDGTIAKIAADWDLTDSLCFGEEGTYDVMNNEEDAEETVSFFASVASIFSKLSPGIVATIAIFTLTLLFSLPLGFLVNMAHSSKFAPLSVLAKVYISILRGTPLMLQLLVVFFGPYYVFHMQLSNSYRFYAVIIGFSLNYAAYFAEIYRSGLEAIPQGQYEAAAILGYSPAKTFTRIIFPQMIKITLPSITNEVITLVKDTSLAFSLAYAEMFTMAKQVAAASASITPLFVAGIFYYVFNAVVAWVMSRIERKMRY